MILILNILDMIIIFCGSTYVLQGKCVSLSWVITMIMSLIETPIIMTCTTMANLLLEQLINDQMITPSFFFNCDVCKTARYLGMINMRHLYDIGDYETRLDTAGHKEGIIAREEREQ